MNNKKIALFFVAENHAGKTSIAKGLEASFPTIAHYSIRAVIQKAYTDQYGVDSSALQRDHIQTFSEMMKAEYGPAIFIEEAVQLFNDSSLDLCIIESLRAPGEAAWITSTEFELRFPDILPLIIGITAPVEDRLKRFLSKREDNIAFELTEEEFYRHETLSNHGAQDTPWEENIKETFTYVDLTVNNANRQLDEALEKICELIASLQNAA